MVSGKIFALLGGLCWGMTPIFTKKALASVPIRLVLSVQATSGFLVLMGIMQWGSDESLRSPSLAAIGVYIAVGFLGSFVARGFYTKGIQKVGAARSNSLTNSSPLLTTILGALLLNEPFTPAIGGGVLFIVFGIYLISVQRSAPGPFQFRRIDLLWPLASGAIYGFNPIIKRLGMILSNTPLMATVYSHGTAMVSFAIMALMQRKSMQLGEMKRRHLVYAVIGGCTISLGQYLTFLALQNQLAIVVSPLWRTSPLVSLVISYFFLREAERVTWADAFGAVAIVCGIFVLTRLA